MATVGIVGAEGGGSAADVGAPHAERHGLAVVGKDDVLRSQDRSRCLLIVLESGSRDG